MFSKGDPKPPSSGRRKGVPNQRSVEIRERIKGMGCDLIGYLALTVNNRVPCATCRGEGKTQFQPHKGNKPGVRVCQSCWGSGLERLAPRERSWAAGELLQYCEAKRKAVELSTPDGPLDNVMRVVFVDAEQGKRKE